MLAGTWLVVASVAAGVGTLALVRELWQYRDKPGAGWFLAALGCQALSTGVYATALLTFDPTRRLALAVLFWSCIIGMGVFFLTFAVAYTGRSYLLDPWGARVAVALPVGTVVLAATNHLHGLGWTTFEVVPAYGVATASYAFTPWAFATAAASVTLPALGSLLLFDTVLSYCRLYRGEAVAVGLSALPPIAAFLVWLFGVGPVPELNLVTAALVPHVALDAYAFGRSDMFEFHPATRRTGERAAIEDLGNPVVIVDEQSRVVTLNAAAIDVLDVEKESALTNPLDEFLDGEHVDPTADDQRVALTVDGTPRTYLVTTTPLRDGSDTDVGYTVVFQDVTDELQREQRLEVLNRVLRHNLRNDMNVVRGFATTAGEKVDDDEAAAMLDTVQRKADDLVALGDKARDVERVVASDTRATTVALDEVLTDVVDGLAADRPGATVTVECPPLSLETDEETLRVVCEAIVENALEHGSTDGGASVSVTGAATGSKVTVRVVDDGPGIPDHELAVLDAGHETDLEHSTGLGLWLANWGTRQLGGDLSFAVGDDGTEATITIPHDGQESQRQASESAVRT